MKTSDTPWETDLYHVSPFNFIPEIQDQYYFREPFLIQDFTIAKMDHMEATRLYAVEEYKEIAQLLDEVGIKETVFMTATTTATPKDQRALEALRAIAKMGLKMKLRIQGWYAAWGAGEYKERIDRMADTGADSINLSALPPHILEQFRLAKAGPEFDEMMRELPKAIEYARKKGLEVSVSSAHAGRDQISTIIERANIYIDQGAQALLMADSKGVATPEATRYLLSNLRAGLKQDVPIYYHAHNNFDTGTSLALAAASSGAWPQATVNGIADRGFASLEGLVMSLELLYGVPTGINLKLLPQLSRTLERITGIPNPPNKPITGAFINIPGLAPGYIGALQGKSFLELEVMTPYELELVGMRPQLVMTYGLLSVEAVETKLRQMGLPTGEADVQNARNALRKALDSLGNKFPVMLNDVEVEQVCREALGR